MKTKLYSRPKNIRRHTVRIVGCMVACATSLAPKSFAGPAIPGASLDHQITMDISNNTPLDEALATWGTSIGMAVVIDADATEKRVVGNGLHGTISARAALQLLLKKSGLSYAVQGDTVYVVPKVTASQSQATGALRLASADVMNFGTDSTFEASSAALDDAQTDHDSLKDLEEVVVTAQKREEKLQDVPIAISVMSGTELENSTYMDTRDALATIPGLATIQDAESGGTLLSLRGVTSTGDLFSGSTPIGYYIDGVPFGLVRSAIVPDANVYDLQRIEVLNGPQGTLYGASALNGVIRILTNDPDLHDFDFKGRTTDSTTDHGGENYDGDMAVNIPIVTDKLALRVVAGDEHWSGWLNSAYGNHTNDSDIGNERIKLYAQPTDTLSIGLSAWHSEVRSAGFPESDSNYYTALDYGDPSLNTFNTYGVTVKKNMEVFDISSVTSYIAYDDKGMLDLTPEDNAFGLFTDTHSRVYSEELNITSKSSGPWKWSGGVFYRNAQDISYQTDTFFPSPPIFGDRWRDTSKSEAVFGELGRQFFGDQLEITAGARYFHDIEGTQAYGTPSQLDIISSEGYSIAPSTATASVGTPRATVTWKPNKDFTAYLSYGQGFRAGFPQGYFTQAFFPAAAPDKLTNYEIGVKGDALDQHLAYTAAAYYIRWTGLQQSLSYTPTTGPLAGISEGVVANANAASGPGVEFSVTARPVNDWNLSVAFSWNDLTYNQTVDSDITSGSPLFLKGDRLDESPEFTASFSTSYLFPIAASGLKGQISASEQYTSSLDSVDVRLGSAANAPSNSVLIGRANFSLIFPNHWSTSIYVDNFANYNGMIQGGGQTPYFSTRTLPRTVGVKVDYHLR